MIGALLRRAAARASAPTDLAFTRRQLYYETCRLLLPVHLLPRPLAFTVPPVLPYRWFTAALRRAGDLDRMLPEPDQAATAPGAMTAEPDLFDYALPRLLICQSPAVAAMLRANGTPMESACPVLSLHDLPLHDGLVRMLAQTAVDGAEGATIYVLHDDSPEGWALPGRLESLTDLPDTVTVTPIGLRRSQTAPLHLPRRGPRRSAPVDVEAVPPAMLLRSVHRLVRGVHRRPEPIIDLRAARSAGFLTWPHPRTAAERPPATARSTR
ncbi:hypothetical protein [Gordonia hydrophobica]|uniref:Uncharacterized protein n=1 Tax=Gordonia hydrophobica TaxID=40516 RepID=A0ABZ2U3G4_9ACTN|nr:hypothetical protein [Gordonia hydrophobica]MBM7367517.1 hypothetical protein [Gordonia hydrophobica]